MWSPPEELVVAKQVLLWGIIAACVVLSIRIRCRKRKNKGIESSRISRNTSRDEIAHSLFSISNPLFYLPPNLRKQFFPVKKIAKSILILTLKLKTLKPTNSNNWLRCNPTPSASDRRRCKDASVADEWGDGMLNMRVPRVGQEQDLRWQINRQRLK